MRRGLLRFFLLSLAGGPCLAAAEPNAQSIDPATSLTSPRTSRIVSAGSSPPGSASRGTAASAALPEGGGSPAGGGAGTPGTHSTPEPPAAAAPPDNVKEDRVSGSRINQRSGALNPTLPRDAGLSCEGCHRPEGDDTTAAHAAVVRDLGNAAEEAVDPSADSIPVAASEPTSAPVIPVPVIPVPPLAGVQLTTIPGAINSAGLPIVVTIGAALPTISLPTFTRANTPTNIPWLCQIQYNPTLKGCVGAPVYNRQRDAGHGGSAHGGKMERRVRRA